MTIAPERPVIEDTSTPESQRVDRLQDMLADPAYSPWREQILAAIRKLTATTILGA